jgi:hypothetical protein
MLGRSLSVVLVILLSFGCLRGWSDREPHGPHDDASAYHPLPNSSTDVAQASGNAHDFFNTTFNKELEVINMGKIDYRKRNRTRKPLLCVAFVKASAEPLKQLQTNMNVMKAECEWAVVFYDGTDGDISAFCGPKSNKVQRKASRIPKSVPDDEPAEIEEERTVITVVHCKRAVDTIERPTTSVELADGRVIEQKLSVPKTALYQELLPVLPYYEDVFLLDEDISLEGFKIQDLMRVWKCVYTEDIRPLIVQPLIVERTQYFPYVHLDAWKSMKRKVYAAATGLVEQQVPLFDAVFFEWMVRRVLSQTREIALKQGVDQSHDRTWCRAGIMYGKMILQRNYTSFTSGGACAVIVGGYAYTAVHHLNTRSLENKKANRAAYRDRAQDVLAK